MFSNEEFGRIARIYAGIFVFLVFLWLIGVNVVVWKRYRVNYVFIFEFDPRHHLHVPNYFELISILTILQVYSFFFFVYRIGENYLDPDYYPVILFITYAVFILNPLNIIYRSSRYWLLNVFFRLVTTPLFKVEFKDFLVADLLCSQVYVLLGIQYTLCLYLSSSEDHLVCDPKRGFFFFFFLFSFFLSFFLSFLIPFLISLQNDNRSCNNDHFNVSFDNSSPSMF